MKTSSLITALSFATFVAAPAVAEPERYALDASHSQIIFSYNHLGFSTTYGMFSGFNGEIMFDAENPENSSVSVSMPVNSMFTGWERRDGHFMSEDFFNASDDDSVMVTFTSTSIEVTGDDTANISGDLTLNGVTLPVVLETKLNKSAPHPRSNKPWIGFDATTTLLRTDYNVGAGAPFVSDEVNVWISVEAEQAEG